MLREDGREFGFHPSSDGKLGDVHEVTDDFVFPDLPRRSEKGCFHMHITLS